tara:strand:+ start:294 stop:515 length:222 start_codon:yes stop_codon:yes gene_type:complete
MDNNPNSYIILVETKDNAFKALTNKLNVREAREKLEVINLALSKATTEDGEEPAIKRAFIFNIDAATEGGQLQ